MEINIKVSHCRLFTETKARGRKMKINIHNARFVSFLLGNVVNIVLTLNYFFSYSLCGL